MDNNPEKTSRKKVVLKINFEDVAAIKLQLKRLQERNPELQYGPIKIGHLGDDVVMSFDIEEGYYGLLLEKLEFTGAKSIVRNENANFLEKKEAQENQPEQQAQKNTQASYQTNAQGLKNNTVKKDPNSLESLVADGEYEKVIDLSKNVKAGYQMMKKAKESVEEAVKNAIKITFGNGSRNRAYLEESITKLIQIGTDKRLKLLNKTDLMTAAGLRAIKLCDSSTDNISDLILIANNNMLPNIVTIKAASKFSETIFKEPEKYEEDFKYAQKYLNTRWILIAKDVVINQMSLTEKLNIKNLVEYIDSVR